MNRSPQATQSTSGPRKLICVGDPETLPADVAARKRHRRRHLGCRCRRAERTVGRRSLDRPQSVSAAERAAWHRTERHHAARHARGRRAARFGGSRAVGQPSIGSVVWAKPEESLAGINFYELLSNPEIMGPDFCPFHTALATGEESNSTLHTRRQSLLSGSCRADRPAQIIRAS